MIKPISDIPALLLRSEKNELILVVSDLHLGFEINLSERGINIPSQSHKLLVKIKRLVKRYNPSKIIFLGDLKHNVIQISLREWRDVPVFLENLLKLNISIDVIIGNHDGNLTALVPRSINIFSSRGITLKLNNGEYVGLIHGHAWPSKDIFKANTIIMGHIHPMIELKDVLGFKFIEPIWMMINISTTSLIKNYLKYLKIKNLNNDPLDIFTKKFGFIPKTSKIIVMPAFNRNLGGISVNKIKSTKLLGPILAENIMKPEKSEIYLLDGTYLGTLTLIKKLQ